MTPTSEDALSDAIRSSTGPMVIRGGGTRDIGRPASGAVLNTTGLTGIRLYEPGALTLVAAAGTPLDEVNAVLAAENQRLPFEPMDHRPLLGTSGAPTIGGVVAGNISGPRRIQAGACRDYMLGVRFVDGTGRVLSNGGRVMKNVTGYDLVKLMTGSWGTLGVLTEVSLKVLPRPEAAACVLVDGLEDHRAVHAMSLALGSPFDVTGAAHTPKGLDGAPVTMVRVEGFEGSVAYRAGELSSLLSELGPTRIESDPARVEKGWAWVRDVGPMQDAPGDVWKLSVKPSDAPDLVAHSGAETALYDWGGGLVWLLMPSGSDLRARLGPFAGHATLVRASEQTRNTLPVFQPEPAPLAALSAGLRAQFDPKGVLNPGLMAA